MLESLLHLEARLHEIMAERPDDGHLRQRLKGVLRLATQAAQEHHAECAKWAGITATLMESGLPDRLLRALERGLSAGPTGPMPSPRASQHDYNQLASLEN